jgi:hypothetical protein
MSTEIVQSSSDAPLGASSERISQAKTHETIVPVKLPTTFVSKDLDSVRAISNVCDQIHGPVSLKRLVVKVKFMEEDANLDFVLYRTGATKSEDEIAFMPNVEGLCATKLTLGKWTTWEASVPDGLANQISPVSGEFPGLAIAVSVSGKMKGAFYFYLEIGGTRLLPPSSF